MFQIDIDLMSLLAGCQGTLLPLIPSIREVVYSLIYRTLSYLLDLWRLQSRQSIWQLSGVV